MVALGSIRILGALAAIGCIMLCHTVGLAFFVGGFLLTRYEVPSSSKCDDWPAGSPGTGDPFAGCWLPRRFDTAVVIVIDALRYDFAAPVCPHFSIGSGDSGGRMSHLQLKHVSPRATRTRRLISRPCTSGGTCRWSRRRWTRSRATVAFTVSSRTVRPPPCSGSRP